jgi:hypothetical protein
MLCTCNSGKTVASSTLAAASQYTRVCAYGTSCARYFLIVTASTDRNCNSYNHYHQSTSYCTVCARVTHLPEWLLECSLVLHDELIGSDDHIELAMLHLVCVDVFTGLWIPLIGYNYNIWCPLCKLIHPVAQRT